MQNISTINDAICICEIKSRIAMVRAAFKQKRLFSPVK
jgi:hypothetical protein